MNEEEKDGTDDKERGDKYNEGPERVGKVKKTEQIRNKGRDYVGGVAAAPADE